MFQSPVSESKDRSHTSPTVAAPEPRRELHPRSAGFGIPLAHATSNPAGRPGPAQLRHLQSTIGNRAVMRSLSQTTPRIQAKRTIDQPGDQYEQQADHVADKVMRMSLPESMATPVPSTSGAPALQRTSLDRDGKAPEPLQMSSAVSGDFGSTTASPAVHEELRSAGVPLTDAARDFMEPRFSQDFRHVRVHTGASAERSADALNAAAYTAGNHIVFGHGHFAPQTHEGQRLLAHELTHVVQQQGAPHAGVPSRIQRKAKGDGKLKIVEIIAFENSLQDAQAKLSDDSVQPIELAVNGLSEGDYFYDYAPRKNPEHKYVDRDSNKVKQALGWKPATAIEGPQPFAAVVHVRILKGNSLDLYAKLSEQDAIDEDRQKADQGAYDTHFSQFLTKKNGRTGTYADLKEVLDAVEILHNAGVSEGEILLLQQQRENDEAMGIKPTHPLGAKAWAEDFVAKREVALASELQSTVANRNGLDAEVEKIDNFWPKKRRFALFIKELSIVNRKGIWPILEEQFKKKGIDLKDFFSRFEVEMRNATTALLTQGRVALIRIEKQFLQGENVGTESSRLKYEIDTMNGAVARQKAAAAKVEAAEKEDKREAHKGNYDNAHTADAFKGELKDAEKALEDHKRVSRLGIVQDRGLELDASTPHKLAGSQTQLAQFVYETRQKMARAEKLLLGNNIQPLYKADQIVALAKSLVGVKKDSIADAMIDYHATIVTSDEPLWREVFNLVSMLVSLIPGPIGVAARVVSALANVTLTVDDYADDSTIHDLGYSSAAPGKLGLILTTGGALLDLGSAAGAVAKSGGEIGSLGRLLRGGEKTATTELKNIGKAAAKDAVTDVKSGTQVAGADAAKTVNVDAQAAKPAAHIADDVAQTAKGEVQTADQVAKPALIADDVAKTAKDEAQAANQVAKPATHAAADDVAQAAKDEDLAAKASRDEHAGDTVHDDSAKDPQNSDDTHEGDGDSPEHDQGGGGGHTGAPPVPLTRKQITSRMNELGESTEKLNRDLKTALSSIDSADKLLDILENSPKPGPRLIKNAEDAAKRLPGILKEPKNCRTN